MKGNWKPRIEYQTLAEHHKPILTRCQPVGQFISSGPIIVIYKDGHFYPCPGAPIFYGNNQCGWWTHDHFDEWMEIPE
jgi:hypothetical protein